MICGICGATGTLDLREYYGEYMLYNCSTCDVEFWSPMKNPGPSYYTTVSNQNIGPFTKIEIDKNHRWVLNNLPLKKGDLLDIGCGIGIFVNATTQVGFQATGIDFVSEFINIGKKIYPNIELKNMALEEFHNTHSDTQFDVITCFEVLEHLDRPSGFLDLVRNMLHQGGYFALSTPNRERYRWQQIHEPWDFPPHHLTRWNQSSLIRFLKFHGFKVVKLLVSPAQWSLEYHFHQYFHTGILNRLTKNKNLSSNSDTFCNVSIVKKPFFLNFALISRDIFIKIISYILIPFGMFLFRGRQLVIICQKN